MAGEEGANGSDRCTSGEPGLERARARAMPEGEERADAKRSSDSGTGCCSVRGEGAREAPIVGSSSSASAIVNSDRASAVAFGGSEPPSDMVRRMLGTEAELEGRSTRMADSAPVEPRLTERDVGGSESRVRDELCASFDGLFLSLLLFAFSADECRRARELSLLLQGSTSRVKYLVPAASKYGFVDGSCNNEMSACAAGDDKARKGTHLRVDDLLGKRSDPRYNPLARLHLLGNDACSAEEVMREADIESSPDGHRRVAGREEERKVALGEAADARSGSKRANDEERPEETHLRKAILSLTALAAR